MSEHLPECPTAWMRDCICTELRLCEPRIREEWYEAQSEAWEQGFHHALNAAREAVLAYADETHKHVGDPFEICRLDEGDRCNTTAALRAVANRIDALREGRK